jgi:hypothetical protein
MLNSKIIKAEVYGHFQDGRCCYLGNSSACYKMGYYRPIPMKFSAQTKTDIVSLEITKAEVYGQFQDGAAAILELQVRATKRAIIAQF